MFGRAKNELDKPPVAREDGAVEILRVWGGENLPQQYSLLPTWEDPAAWGMLLVDIARHAAKAYSDTGGMSEAEALARLKAGFDVEWGTPTDAPVQLG